MPLIAYSKNQNKSSPVACVTCDGSIITHDGGYGDLNVDCHVEWDQSTYLKTLREHKRMTQKEMAWCLGVSRQTYIKMECGNSEMTHKSYLLSRRINEDIPETPEEMLAKMKAAGQYFQDDE